MATSNLPKRGKTKRCNGFSQINGLPVKPDMEFVIMCGDDGQLYYLDREGEPRLIRSCDQGKNPLYEDRLATVRAGVWWDTIGRHTINQKANKESVDHYKPGGANTPAIKVKGTPVITLPSGILRGIEFNRLTEREQKQVVLAWRREAGQISDAEFDGQADKSIIN